MELDTFFVKEEIHEVAKVPPAFIGRNIAEKVLDIIRATYGDRCSKYGFIRNGSIEIVKVGAAQVELHSLCGYVNVGVIFSALTLNPPEKSFIRAQVRNINKFGILTAVELDGRDVMQIIIPKQIALMRSSVNLDRVFMGQRVTVEIVKRRIEIGESVLYGIGRIVEDAQPRGRKADGAEEEFEPEDPPNVVLRDQDEDLLLQSEGSLDIDDDDDDQQSQAGEAAVEGEVLLGVEDDDDNDDDVDDDGQSEVFSIDDAEEQQADAE